MDTANVLSLENALVRRGATTILGPVTMRVREGERWVILGPNGAGKSTLMKLMAAMSMPTAGTVEILGKVMGRTDVFELRPRIGFCSSVLAENIPFDERVRDVVLTAAYAIVGRWNEDYDLWDESRAVALLTTFGVRDLGERLYGTLSEGERKRVQICRSLMADPEVLLLDEPAAGLDVGGREDVLQRFAEFSQDPAAPVTILITHHIEEIPRGTTHALLLKDGKIAVSGPIDDVITSEHISSVFNVAISVNKSNDRFWATAI
ncbi:MAG: ATP-binding cassette domain-containing protein [Actinobacteria bacterium]|nr:ABC transporter ATP-binding protein [Actinomycetota bacterium]MSW46782.1 ATP-binding cassette domain-containing protein [Actinomycetota bacterium]MSX24536.1 ATP-binding cassette domain-containing protein [Actinomycetota bacterium]MSY46833.1 ATP-binding cassette domain-containing protein [Actinomycetota bacterium]MTB00220.1 ATP-binding cassette domain-containing protein [Actinomycetota bacterium]